MTTAVADVRRPWQDVPVPAGVAAVTLALLAGPALGEVVSGPRPVLAALAIAALTQAVGRALVPVLGLPATAPAWLVSVVLGYAVTSAVHLAATAWFNLTAGAALGVDAVLAGGLWLLRHRIARTCVRQDTVPPSAPREPARAWAVQVGVLVGCALLSTLWARETIRAMPTVEAGGVFPAWQDYFLHGAEVSYLRDYPSYERRSQYLTAAPQPLYHRGSFALAAAFSLIGGAPSLATATAYWLPTGLLLTIAATAAWGLALGGPLAALGAVAAAFVVPDASNYGAENRFLSFEWLMQMASGSGYGLAVVLVALTVLSTAARTGVARSIVTAGGLVGLAAMFRVHVAVLAAAMVGWYGLFSWRPRVTGRGLAAAAALLLAAAGGLWWMESVSLAPHFLTGRSHPVLFFLSVHTQANDLPSVFRAWRETHGDVVNVAFGFALMLWAGLGAWIALLPVVASAGGLGPLGRRVWLLPLALLFASLTVILVVPTPAHGDITDFGHRPFVLVYLVFAALTGAALGRRVADWTSRTGLREGQALAAASLLVGAALVLPWQQSARVQQRWVPQYATMILSADAVRAGAYIREHGLPGEQILAASEDHYARYVALSERRAYLSRGSLFQILGPPASDAAVARAGMHARLGAAPTFEQLRAFGQHEGIAWYVADLPATHQWPADTVDRCAYCGDELRVYDLR